MAIEKPNMEKNYYLFTPYGEFLVDCVGPVGLITNQIDQTLASSINNHLYKRREQYSDIYLDLKKDAAFLRHDYRIAINHSRFTTGEGKTTIMQPVRGHDIFIIADVLNYGLTTQRFNQELSLSPDDHYTDIIRLVTSAKHSARRVNVIMPFLYEGRRYVREGRESRDCALMLKCLFAAGVDNFITFDAHDSRINNAVPVANFENVPTSFQIIEGLLNDYPDIHLTPDCFSVISPDETGIARAAFYASLMKVPLGIFYRQELFKRSRTNNLKYIGDSIQGKDILVIDDMIVSGETILNAINQLKTAGAKRVFIITSYGIFTNGIERFNQASQDGLFEKIYATNLNYHPTELLSAPWFKTVDLSQFIALIIDAINHDASLSKLLNPTSRIQNLLEKRRL